MRARLTAASGSLVGAQRTAVDITDRDTTTQPGTLEQRLQADARRASAVRQKLGAPADSSPEATTVSRQSRAKAQVLRPITPPAASPIRVCAYRTPRAVSRSPHR